MNAHPMPPAHPQRLRVSPTWQLFLARIHKEAQAARFADTEPHWADTEPNPEAIPGLQVTEHQADDAVTRRVFALLEGDGDDGALAPGGPGPRVKHGATFRRGDGIGVCPPCNGDCLQGDDCTAFEWQTARAERARLAAESIEARHPWLWPVYCAVIALTIWASSKWPWGFFTGVQP